MVMNRYYILWALVSVAVAAPFALNSCGDQPSKRTVVADPGPTSPTPPPATTCADGSPVGATRTQACPSGQTGSDKQVCAATGWVDTVNTCSGTPAPSCNKTQFADVQPILTKYCLGCHVSPGKIDDYATASAWATEIARRIALPAGDAEHMPKGSTPQLSDTEEGLLAKWVADGAIQSCSTASVPSTLTLDYIETAMVNDLQGLNADDRPSIRYLITAGAVNANGTPPATSKIARSALVNAAPANDGSAANPETWRAAMDKALNGMNSVGQDLFAVTPVDPAHTVWRFDIRDYNISPANLKAVEAADPVNIVSTTTKGTALAALAGTTKPWFHADNWIDITHRNSTVYYGMLKIPATTAALQTNIGADLNGQIKDLSALFIGSAQSPIAEQKNRLLVRADQARTLNAYYWQSFDVNDQPAAGAANTKNLFQFPLLAAAGGVANYTADASEVIYTLPNGLQAYMLADGAGNRLDAAAGNVVRDNQSPISAIINDANSCSRCHNAGLIPMQDQIAASVTAAGTQIGAGDVQLVQALYKSPAAGSATFVRDNKLFAAALSQLKINPLQPDPLNVVTDRFLLNWDLKQAAGFLFLTPDQLTQAIKTSPTASAQIAQLISGGTVAQTQFLAVLPQLIKDARLFQDPLN